MKLYRHFEPVDHQKIHETVKAAYGVEHPEMISGYYGTFHLHRNDIYLSDAVARWAKSSKEFGDYVDDCIDRFFHDDLGFVTEWEESAYIEDRYIAGSTSWYLGRYSRRHMPNIVVADLYDIMYVSFFEEDAADVYNAQIGKCPHPYCSDGKTADDIMRNEIRYVKAKGN